MAQATLARHIEDVVARALNELPQEDRVSNQAELVNRVIELSAAPSSKLGPLPWARKTIRLHQALTGVRR